MPTKPCHVSGRSELVCHIKAALASMVRSIILIGHTSRRAALKTKRDPVSPSLACNLALARLIVVIPCRSHTFTDISLNARNMCSGT